MSNVAVGLAVLLATASSVESRALFAEERLSSSNDQVLLGSTGTAASHKLPRNTTLTLPVVIAPMLNNVKAPSSPSILLDSSDFLRILMIRYG